MCRPLGVSEPPPHGGRAPAHDGIAAEDEHFHAEQNATVVGVRSA